MGGFYAKVTNISGAKSSVATSAYMSREKLKDEQMNHTFNYSKHEHDNTFSNICLCPNAPTEWQNKEKLWNAVEEAEKGKNTRKAKQWILAIPQELTQEQQEDAVKKFQEFLAEKGMCSQADIHEAESTRSKTQIEKNKHVHVLATQRLIDENGEWVQIKEKKVYANCMEEGRPSYNPDLPTDAAHRIPKIDPLKVEKWEQEHGQKFDLSKAAAEDKEEVQKLGARNRKEWERITIQDNPLNKKELIEESRQKWADICNQYLSTEQKIDNRSYERQGVERISELHEGIGTHLEYDDRVEYNKTVKRANEQLEVIKSVHPREADEIKESLHGIRQSLDHDRDSRRTEAAAQRTTRSDHVVGTGESGTKAITQESGIFSRNGETQKREEQQQYNRNNAVKGESQYSAERENGSNRSIEDSRRRSREFSQNIEEYVTRTAERRGSSEGVGEQQREIRSRQQTNGSNLERMGRQVQYSTGKIENLGAEQRSINEKLTAIRDRIKQAFERIRARFSKPRNEVPDNRLEKPTSEPVKQQRSEPIMGALSRFNEIAANQEKAREEQTDREKEKVTSTDTGNTTEERPSALDKLRKYEQQAKEGRTEQLQSEKNQEQQQQTIRRNRLRR